MSNIYILNYNVDIVDKYIINIINSYTLQQDLRLIYDVSGIPTYRLDILSNNHNVYFSVGPVGTIGR